MGTCRYHEEAGEDTESECCQEWECEIDAFHSEEEEEYAPTECTGCESADNREEYM